VPGCYLGDRPIVDAMTTSKASFLPHE
jgi:hypothetical protein